MKTVYKTAVFKLHNPSKHRKAMLIDCMQRAEHAYWKVLNKIKPEVDAMKDMDRKERRQALFALKKKIDSYLVPLPLAQSAQRGVQEDTYMQASSYLELLDSGQEAGWPERKDRDADYFDQGLERLVNYELDESAYNEARDLLNKRPHPGTPRPLRILRNDVGRGMLLLEDDKKRLFAWINLHRATSRYAKKKEIDGLVNVRTGEVMKFSSKIGELFPLECSDWHYDAFIKRGHIQSSMVFCRGDTFYLAVTFGFEAEEDIKTETVLGVDRGIDELAAYAVVDGACNLMSEGMFSGEGLRDYQRKREKQLAREMKLKGHGRLKWRGYGDQIIHIIANQIVDKALEHKSQVILENLSNIKNNPNFKRPKYQPRVGFSRMLNRQQYGKLEHILEYKLLAAGLPKPKFVRAAFTSMICNHCGHNDKANRDKDNRSQFACTNENCEYKHHADLNAAANIASKYVWWESIKGKVKKGDKLRKDQRFDAWLAMLRADEAA